MAHWLFSPRWFTNMLTDNVNNSKMAAVDADIFVVLKFFEDRR